MTALLVIVGLLLGIVIYLLFAPIRIEIDSRVSLYQIRFHKIAMAKIYATDSSLFLEIHITMWHKAIDLFAVKEAKPTASEKIRTKRKAKISMAKMISVIRSFRLSKCNVSLDTGNMELNGILYPCLLWMSALSGKDININFINQNEIVLEIDNTLIQVLRAYLYQ